MNCLSCIKTLDNKDTDKINNITNFNDLKSYINNKYKNNCLNCKNKICQLAYKKYCLLYCSKNLDSNFLEQYNEIYKSNLDIITKKNIS